MKVIGIVVLAATLCVCSGCAGITGLVTGPVTGAVDLPAETYRHNRPDFDNYPILFGLDCLVVGPCGIVVGPVTGLCKGVSMDVLWILDRMEYSEVFGTYGPASIWRPCTIQWSAAPAPR